MSSHLSRCLVVRVCSIITPTDLSPRRLLCHFTPARRHPRHVCAAALSLHRAVDETHDLTTHIPQRRLLFEPITLAGQLHLPNRVCMQPLYLNMERELGCGSAEHMRALATFYAERAHYGAKLIIVGGLGTSRWGRWHGGALMLTTQEMARALRGVTDAVHDEGGYILAQAFHAGRAARHRWYSLSATNEKPSSSSSSAALSSFTHTRSWAIPAWGVDYVVSEYERLAGLAREAGFDGVEIPVSEGSLLHNFFSPAVNHRHDRFGGSLPRRMEMVIRVLERVHAALGHTHTSSSSSSSNSSSSSSSLFSRFDRRTKPKQQPHAEPSKPFILSLRLCLHDLKPHGGSPMSDTLLAAELLAQSGYLHLLNTSVGMHDSPVQTLSSCVPQASFARGCAQLRQHLRRCAIALPIVASHRIHSVAVAERLLQGGVCDMVGLARPLLADAQWIAKAAQNRARDILPCIACNHCVHRFYTSQRVGCALNPLAGYEMERGCVPAAHARRIAVIGAGPAGLTCALTLWRRGHVVSLFERGPHVGGQLHLATAVPGKESYQAVLEYWTRALRRSTVAVHLNTEFTLEDLSRQRQSFHGLVLAVGGQARPVSSHFIPGAQESPLVVTYEAILSGRVRAGRRVVIIGHGALAYDVASYLLHDPRVSREVRSYLEEWGVDWESGSLVSLHDRVEGGEGDEEGGGRCERPSDASDEERSSSNYDALWDTETQGPITSASDSGPLAASSCSSELPASSSSLSVLSNCAHEGLAEAEEEVTRRGNRECGDLVRCPAPVLNVPRNNRDVILIDWWNKDAGLLSGKGWSQKLWIRKHGGTIIRNGMVTMIDAHGVHIHVLVPHPRDFFVPCDTVVWCCGVLPNASLGMRVFEWARDGAIQRGELNSDFAIYMAGACRDSTSGEGNGEADLMQAVHEGYEIGRKI